MGIDYSVNLYYKSHQIESALLGIVAIADIYDEESTIIELPDNREITIPFAAIPKTVRVKFAPNQEHSAFCTTLIFPVDQQIESYLEGTNHKKEANLASIGCIYLRVDVGDRYAELSFTAATSSMSRMFLNSSSVHNRFNELLKSTGGLFGLFDIEESYYLSLANLHQRVGDCSNEFEGGNLDSFRYRIDKFTESCLLHKECCMQ